MDDYYVDTWSPGELAFCMLSMHDTLVNLELLSEAQSKVKKARLEQIHNIVMSTYDKFGG